MTDRHIGYIVALDHSKREDDSEFVINAIRMIRGVISVTPVVDDVDFAIAEQKADRLWRDKIYALLKESR